jgi:hypothetical protein
MTRQTTRILWSIALGLGVVLGTSLAAAYDSGAPPAGTSRPIATAPAAAQVTFDDGAAAPWRPPLPAGIAAAIPADGLDANAPAGRPEHLQSPAAVNGKSVEGIGTPSPYTISGSGAERIVMPPPSAPEIPPGSYPPKTSRDVSPAAGSYQPIAPIPPPETPRVIQVHVPPRPPFVKASVSSTPAAEPPAEQPVKLPPCAAAPPRPAESLGQAPSHPTTIKVEIPPRVFEQPIELASGPGMSGLIGAMVEPGAANAAWNQPTDDLFGEAPMLGRGDQNNRFNLFNEQSALVQSHVWFGYHHQFDYDPAIHLTSAARSLLILNRVSQAGVLLARAAAANFLEKTDQDLYRVGFEYGLSPDWSFVFQAQYVSDVGPSGTDGWSSPFFMVKRVIFQEGRAVLAAALAVEPQTEVRVGQFKEKATRWYPGILWYDELDANWVVQGGLQVGLPFGPKSQFPRAENDHPHTLDYDISVGYWLYRSPELLNGSPANQSWRPFVWDNGPYVHGALLQVELLGKHLFGGNRLDAPFGLTNSVTSGGTTLPIFEYIDPRQVLDVTVGGRLLLRCDSAVTVAASVPITGPKARAAELMVYFSCDF